MNSKSNMVLKAVFFPHMGEEFENPIQLRDWLGYGLKKYRRGGYHMRDPSGLGQLEDGSLVFFHKNNLVVGCAVVEEGIRKSTKEQMGRFGEEYQHFIKFIPESIWAWNSGQFITDEEVYSVLGKHLGQGYTIIDSLEELLRLFQLMAKKGTKIL
jgi:hypothetical protein